MLWINKQVRHYKRLRTTVENIWCTLVNSPWKIAALRLIKTTVTRVNVIKSDCHVSVSTLVNPAVKANKIITRTKLTNKRNCVLNLWNQECFYEFTVEKLLLNGQETGFQYITPEDYSENIVEPNLPVSKHCIENKNSNVGNHWSYSHFGIPHLLHVTGTIVAIIDCIAGCICRKLLICLFNLTYK